MTNDSRNLSKQMETFVGLVVVLILLSACQELPKQQQQPLNPMVGGYQSVETSNPDLGPAKALAIADLQRHHPADQPFVVETTETQIVAGINYRLRLVGRSNNYELVVYRDLQGQLSISSRLIVGH